MLVLDSGRAKFICGYINAKRLQRPEIFFSDSGGVQSALTRESVILPCFAHGFVIIVGFKNIYSETFIQKL